jgi:hypothetical protein
MDWVLVHWIDIVSIEHPWISKEEARALEPLQMWSSGVVVKDTEHYLVIAGTIDPTEESFGNVNALPKGIIVSVRRLVPRELPPEVAVEPAVRDAGLG